MLTEQTRYEIYFLFGPLEICKVFEGNFLFSCLVSIIVYLSFFLCSLLCVWALLYVILWNSFAECPTL